MNTAQQHALLTIALLAAFADGANDERERSRIRELAATLGSEAGAPDLTRIYEDVLTGRASLDQAAAVLDTPALRQAAFEAAVGVCDADGASSAAERDFLARLRTALGLAAEHTTATEQAAGALADPALTGVPATAPLPAPTAAPVACKLSDEDMEKLIHNAAVLNGALELLPQSWASVAIIPLQVKMVHRIGQAYGVEMDQGSIKEFLGTVGVGLASQYLEQFGRKLLGGLFGTVGGGVGRGLGSAATGVAFSFATTYALGQVARRYYADGRRMDGASLRDTFGQILGPAKELQARYLPQIQDLAGKLDAGRIMDMLRRT